MASTLRKFARRNKSLVAGAVAVYVVMVAGVVTSSVFAWKENQQKMVAVKAQKEEAEARGRAEDAEAAEVRQREVVQDERDAAEFQAYVANIAAADAALMANEFTTAGRRLRWAPECQAQYVLYNVPASSSSTVVLARIDPLLAV